MDCTTAQGLVSDALDRTPVDAQQLADAKEHCLGCATCSVFVRTLLLVRSTPTPAPSEELIARVMDAIRAEDAQARQAASEAATPHAAATDGDSPIDVVHDDAQAPAIAAAPDAARDERVTALDAIRRWARGRSRQEAITWASAAVIFVAAVGIASSAGIQVLTAPPAADTPMASSREAAPQYGDVVTAAPEAADSAVMIAPAVGTAGSFITVQDVVFLLSGPSTIATEGLTPAGKTTSSLGSGSEPADHTVFKADDPDRLYVRDETSGQLLAFDRVVRTYRGNLYQLTSDALSDFGQWPKLPANITTPSNPDGSPTFSRLADDPSGTPIYRLVAGGELEGIAVGPGSSPTDPAVGNPNWTWWTPAR